MFLKACYLDLICFQIFSSSNFSKGSKHPHLLLNHATVTQKKKKNLSQCLITPLLFKAPFLHSKPIHTGVDTLQLHLAFYEDRTDAHEKNLKMGSILSNPVQGGGGAAAAAAFLQYIIFNMFLDQELRGRAARTQLIRTLMLELNKQHMLKWVCHHLDPKPQVGSHQEMAFSVKTLPNTYDNHCCGHSWGGRAECNLSSSRTLHYGCSKLIIHIFVPCFS